MIQAIQLYGVYPGPDGTPVKIEEDHPVIDTIDTGGCESTLVQALADLAQMGYGFNALPLSVRAGPYPMSILIQEIDGEGEHLAGVIRGSERERYSLCFRPAPEDEDYEEFDDEGGDLWQAAHGSV